MNRKKRLSVFVVIVIAALCFFAIQFTRLNHVFNTEAKNEIGIRPPALLSSPVESILDSYPDYIFLYGLCYEMNEQIFNSYSLCNAFAREAQRLFLVRSLSCKAGSVSIPDDLIICQQVMTKLTNGLCYLEETAISFESGNWDPESPEIRVWLEKVLAQAKRFDVLFTDADLPYSVQTKDDVVCYLVFFRSLSGFADEFEQTICSRTG